MSTMVVQEHHLWINLAEMKDVVKVRFLDASVSQAGLFSDTVEGFAQQFSAVQKQTESDQSTNPGSASLEPGPAQAPVQDADAQVHDQMHPAPGLVCSDRPEECMLSCFDSSATQTVPTVCVRGPGSTGSSPSGSSCLPVSSQRS